MEINPYDLSRGRIIQKFVKESEYSKGFSKQRNLNRRKDGKKTC